MFLFITLQKELGSIMQNNSRHGKNHGVGSSIDEIDLKEMFLYLKGHKWFVIAVSLIALAIGLLYSLTLPLKYNSSALIQIDEGAASSNNMQQLLNSMSSKYQQVEQASIVNIETALIKSRFILEPVIEKLGLNISASPQYFPIIGYAIAHYGLGKELANPLFGFSQYAWGGKKIQVKQFNVATEYEGVSFLLKAEDKSHFKLYLKSGELLLEGVVGKLASTVPGVEPQVKILVPELKANPGSYFKVSRNPIDSILGQVSSSLSIVDIGMLDKSRTGVLQLSLQGDNAFIIPRILNTIINLAIQKNIEKKSSEATNVLIFLKKQLPIIRKSLEEAETNLNNYRAKTGSIDMSQEARILLAQLSRVGQQIEESKLKKVELLLDLTPEHPFIMSLVQRQSQLEQEALILKKEIKSLPTSDQIAVSLQRDVKVKEQLYSLLLNKIQQSQVLEAGTLSDVRILNNATLPTRPLPLHRFFILQSSLLAGFFISISVLFLLKLAQKGPEDPEFVEEQLGITALAIVPFSKNQKKLNYTIQSSVQTIPTVSMLARIDPKDPSIEAIRSLRTALQFSLMGAKNNIIAILGATPGIGKSFITVNLAQILVNSGKKVLIIDADMRKGKICKSLGQLVSPGLSDLLSDQAQVENTIKNIGGGLDFIATGKYPATPAELLLGYRLQLILEKLSLIYDLIIIDTPPLLVVTDAVLISQHVGTNLMVIGANTDHLREIQMATNRVSKNGIIINGLVFNQKMQTKNSYGQYQYYQSYDYQEK